VGTAVGSPPPTFPPLHHIHMHDRFGAGFAGNDDPTSPRGELAAFPAFPVAPVGVTVRRRRATTGRRAKVVYPSIRPSSPGFALLHLAHARARRGPIQLQDIQIRVGIGQSHIPRHRPEGGTRWIVYIGSGQASSCPTYPFIYEASQPASLFA
jgi:hypothetical protein